MLYLLVVSFFPLLKGESLLILPAMAFDAFDECTKAK